MMPTIIGDATLLNCDCMEYMHGLPDKYYDLCICDPPYGIGDALVVGGSSGGWAGMTNSGANKWDVKPPQEYFEELFRVSKNQIIWGGNFFILPECRQPICWDKDRPNQKNASEWEYAWTSFTGRARLFKHCANAGFILPEPRIHPTQKPVKLYEWLLTNYAKPGDRILDTHGGSMSSVIACLNLGFAVTCCERDPDYFATAQARVRNAQRQQPMFAPERTKQEQMKLEVE